MDVDIEELIDLLDSKLIFTTVDGEFEGILKFLMLKEKRATFEHTYHCPSRKYIGTMKVKFYDFVSYQLLESASAILDSSKLRAIGDELPIGDLEKHSRVDKSAVLDNTEVFCHEHLPAHLKHSCPDDYCFIESICPAFFRALNHISGMNTIGVSFHGSAISRNGSLSWICIATPQCMFMFDIANMGIAAFHEGLQKILEDKSIEKVIHDCREPADCLEHLFQTSLNNVFDTQVADYLINMQRYTDEVPFKYVSSLDSCLVKYLNVSPQFLFNRNKCLSMDDEIQFYKIRPITEDFRRVLLKSTIYLLVLKDKLEELLLYPFHQAVNMYLNVLRDAPEAEIFRLSHEFTQIAPHYLSECIKSIRFYDLPVPGDDTISQFRQTPHGEEVWSRRSLMKRLKDLNSKQ